MSDRRGFRYALQPVLMTRRWHREQLQRELGELTAELRRHDAHLDALSAQSVEGYSEWTGLAQAPHGVDTFLLHHWFLSGLQTQMEAERDEIRELELLRDALVARLETAQRALEAMEEHRSDMEKAFVKERMSQEFKQADETWNSRRTAWEDA
jgi:flagellar export protein FliJ